LCLSSPLTKIKENIVKINDDLNAISLWSKKHDLNVNASKSQALVIYSKNIDTTSLPKIIMDGCDIAYVEKAKNLGMFINKTLTWLDHIGYLAKLVFSKLRRLWKISYFLSQWAKIKLVHSLLLPHFLYCDVVYSSMSASELNSLQIIFKACTRFVMNRKKYDRISDASTTILGLSFDKFLKIRYLIYLKKIMLGQAPSYLAEKLTFGRSTRNIKLIIPRHESNCRHLSFFVKVGTLWNSLPNNIKRESRIKSYIELCRKFFEGC